MFDPIGNLPWDLIRAGIAGVILVFVFVGVAALISRARQKRRSEVKGTLIVAFLGFLLFSPLFSIAGERAEVPGIMVYTDERVPTNGYLAFSNTFNDELVGRWKTARRGGRVRGPWAVFVRFGFRGSPEYPDVIVFAIREGREDARTIPVATIPPTRQFSRIAAESAAKRTMRLIIAVEAQERREGK